MDEDPPPNPAAAAPTAPARSVALFGTQLSTGPTRTCNEWCQGKVGRVLGTTSPTKQHGVWSPMAQGSIVCQLADYWEVSNFLPLRRSPRECLE